MTVEELISDEAINAYFDEKEWKESHNIDLNRIMSTSNVENEVIKIDETEKIHEMIKTLLPIEQDAIKMFFYENKGFREIGETLWASPDKNKCYNRGKALVEKALRKLRNPRLSRILHDYVEQ